MVSYAIVIIPFHITIEYLKFYKIKASNWDRKKLANFKKFVADLAVLR